MGSERAMCEVVRIIARDIPWPSLKERPDRSGLRLRWDALTEDGDLLFARTEYPFADGAYALLMRGVPEDTLVTMRGMGSEDDSFVPVPLRVVAEMGRKRAENRAKLATLREGTAKSGTERPEVAETTQGAKK